MPQYRGKLKHAIDQSELNQSQVAKKLGIVKSRMSQIMHGSNVTEKQINQLCKILNITPSVVLELEDASFTPDERKVISIWRTLSPKQQKLILLFWGASLE